MCTVILFSRVIDRAGEGTHARGCISGSCVPRKEVFVCRGCVGGDGGVAHFVCCVDSEVYDMINSILESVEMREVDIYSMLIDS